METFSGANKSQKSSRITNTGGADPGSTTLSPQTIEYKSRATNVAGDALSR